MKKVLSLVLAIMMVLSLTTVAFAETKYGDIDAKNEKLVEAVALLDSLGIVKGYEDGTFKPEKVVSRAEMAKMMVVARGYEQIAAGGTSIFSDTQYHWAKGYIQLATELGIVEGYPDGTFKPDAPVSYNHAVVMMLRTLGYTNESLNGGKSTAYNEALYKTLGLKLGLYDVMPASLVAGANRGDIAMMLETLLGCNMVETNQYGRPSEIVLGEDTNKKPIYQPLFSQLAEKKTLTVNAKTLAAGHKVDLSEYMFQDIEAYFNEDGKIVYVASTLSNVSTIAGIKDGVVTLADKNTINVTTSTAISKDKVFFNGAMATTDKKLGKGQTVVYNNVGTVEAPKYEIVGILYNQITQMNQIIAPYKEGATKIGTVTLPTTKDKKVNLANVKVEGAASALSDILVNDVIQAYEADDAQFVKLVVTRDSIEGKITKRSKETVFIDGTEYGFSYYSSATSVAYEDLKLGKTYTLLLDKDGNLAYIAKTEDVVIETAYGLVTGQLDGTKAKVTSLDGSAWSVTKYPMVRVLLADGTTKDYEVSIALDKDGNLDTNKSSKLVSQSGDRLEVKAAEKVVSYSLDSDGRIKLTEVQLKDAEVKKSSANFLATDSTIVFMDTEGKYSVIKADELSSEQIIVLQYAPNASGAWDVVVVDSKYSAAADEVEVKKFAVVSSKYEVEGGFEYTLLVDGKEETYIGKADVVSTSASALQVYNFSLDGNNNLKSLTAVSGKNVTIGENDVVTDTYIVYDAIGGAIRYTFAENMTIYTLDDDDNVVVGTLADLVKGAKIEIIANANDYVEVIIVK